jgi:hypothetical protein
MALPLRAAQRRWKVVVLALRQQPVLAQPRAWAVRPAAVGVRGWVVWVRWQQAPGARSQWVRRLALAALRALRPQVLVTRRLPQRAELRA